MAGAETTTRIALKNDEEDARQDRTMTAAPGAAASPRVALGALELPSRYQDLGRIAAGGFGEVRRVRDLELDRVVVMKLLRADRLSAKGTSETRFFEEARLTAGLEHPGIVSVHDRGRLEDGRLWFTMREVRGRTLTEVIEEVHAAAPTDDWSESSSGWTFRRLIDTFGRVCQAVAYAHRRGIVHRDLKPDNIMVGELGEALVMDWGLGLHLALDMAVEGPADSEVEVEDVARLTRYGDVLGTPAYMPPEQAAGARDLHGFASDVYSLGAVLYQALAGRPPYQGGSASAVVRQVLAGPPQAIPLVAAGRSVPAELVTISERAMARSITDRYRDAEALSVDVLAWLDGAHRRSRALAVVEKARALAPELTRVREEIESKRKQAAALLEGVRTFDPVERKAPAWSLEDEATQLEVAAAARETEMVSALQGALTLDPDLAEAHEALADHYKSALLDAERAHRPVDAARAESLLRNHDRGRYGAILRGEGALTLVTEPAGARVTLERFVERGRRLVAEPAGELGTTPLCEVPLQKGSYLLRLTLPGHAEVRYPVLIERGSHQDGCAPGDTEPHAIALPREGELSEDDCYVPAAWTIIGGDDLTCDSLSERRVWLPGFVIRRFPVTTREYLTFLNDLVERGDEASALAACPRVQLGLAQGGQATALERDADGRFALPRDEGGLGWHDWPVVMVDWYAACAYAAWFAARSAKPWRLPNELEREKASRGVDGRYLPWGDAVEPTFACVGGSSADEGRLKAVFGHPSDESVYGVRGLAGNSRDWCENVWAHDGPPTPGGRLLRTAAKPDDMDFRAIKGGAWASTMAHARAAARFALRPDMGRSLVGGRLVRSLA